MVLYHPPTVFRAVRDAVIRRPIAQCAPSIGCHFLPYEIKSTRVNATAVDITHLSGLELQ